MAEALPAGAPTKAAAGGYNVGGATVCNKQGPLKAADLASLTCSSCKLILREPQQVTSCGHRYCKVCIDQLRSVSKDQCVCPVDGMKYNKQEVRYDKGCWREIQDLEVDCPTQPHPCPWKGKLTEMETHLGVCPNRVLACSHGCGGHYKKEKLEEHMMSECPMRPTSCQYCNQMFPLQALNDHYQSCQEYPVNCEFCEKALSSRKELPLHFKECTEFSMSCPYKECQFKGKRNAMNKHLLASHLIQLVEDNIEMHEELRTVKSENQKLCGEISLLTSRVDELVITKEHNIEEIETLKNVVTQLEKEREERDCKKAPQRQLADTVEADSVSTRPPKQEPTSSKKPPRTLSSLSMAADTETDRAEKEMKYYTQLQKLTENVQAIQNSFTQYAIAIDEVRLRQDVLDVKTTNGTFIWKIPDIRRRYRDAVDGKTVSLYSPPFYTSPHGYRVCIRTYLNGDGIGKSTHISVFFFIMRSEHDNLLPWPFKQSVRFTLVNQKNQAASITEAFAPDLRSPSFQKPEYDMNVASGFPKFARQSVLQDENFTKDNILYIKCQVDLSGLTLI